MNRKTIACLSLMAVLLSQPVDARQLQHVASPVVVTPEGNIAAPDADEISTVIENGHTTTVYRTHRRIRSTDGQSYSNGPVNTDAMTGALIENIMGGIVSNRVADMLQPGETVNKPISPSVPLQ